VKGVVLKLSGYWAIERVGGITKDLLTFEVGTPEPSFTINLLDKRMILGGSNPNNTLIFVAMLPE
jgi:hypothetical protein